MWIGRAFFEVFFHPQYWNPQTAVDYAAVISFTLALYLLALGLWFIHRERQQTQHISEWLWLAGIGLACFGAVTAGSANFLEDWLAVNAFGDLFVVGGLTLAVGLFLMGISLFWANDLPRRLGLLFISCIFGLADLAASCWFDLDDHRQCVRFLAFFRSVLRRIQNASCGLNLLSSGSVTAGSWSHANRYRFPP